MKRLALTAALVGLAFAASAQTAAPAATDSAAPQTATAPAETTDEASASQNKATAKDEAADRNCLKHTGSRLIRADSKGRKCAVATGRAYNARRYRSHGRRRSARCDPQAGSGGALKQCHPKNNAIPGVARDLLLRAVKQIPRYARMTNLGSRFPSPQHSSESRTV